MPAQWLSALRGIGEQAFGSSGVPQFAGSGWAFMALRDDDSIEPVAMARPVDVAAEPVGRLPVFPVPIRDWCVCDPMPVPYVVGPVLGVVCAYATDTTAIALLPRRLIALFGSSPIECVGNGGCDTQVHSLWLAL